jgi:transcription elongation factor Elf1
MSCDICGRGSCTASFHSVDEYRRYEHVIELFEKAREERERVKHEDDEESEGGHDG